jgi:hypothetical protein
VLVLHVWLNKLLCVLFQQCNPVEETSALTVLHGDLWITTAIDNSNSIPIGLCTIRHEAFEVGILDAVLCHEIVEFSPHDTLGPGLSVGRAARSPTCSIRLINLCARPIRVKRALTYRSW